MKKLIAALQELPECQALYIGGWFENRWHYYKAITYPPFETLPHGYPIIQNIGDLFPKSTRIQIWIMAKKYPENYTSYTQDSGGSITINL